MAPLPNTHNLENTTDLLKKLENGLTTGSKIHVCYNINFLNTCFDYFS